VSGGVTRKNTAILRPEPPIVLSMVGSPRGPQNGRFKAQPSSARCDIIKPCKILPLLNWHRAFLSALLWVATEPPTTGTANQALHCVLNLGRLRRRRFPATRSLAYRMKFSPAVAADNTL
jgi:hypothetical protein